MPRAGASRASKKPSAQSHGMATGWIRAAIAFRDVAVGGFVGSGARPDIEHGLGIAERGPDLRGVPRIGAPRGGVGDRLPGVANSDTREPRGRRQLPVDT
ncbi:hypothetical protein Afe04nite_33250 [Asanoa ferruginea]|nr:hypothetical protein Afe04nite_33250 [Asanoa ferruginea]